MIFTSQEDSLNYTLCLGAGTSNHSGRKSVFADRERLWGSVSGF